MKLSCKYTISRFTCQAILKNILLIFNKVKLYILRKKWFVFDDKTTNLLKYAVFEIND